MTDAEPRAWDDETLARLLLALASDADRTDGWEDAAPDLRQAADRLTSLSAQIEELRAALEPFAHYFDTNDCDERQGNIEVPISDLRRARQALGDHRHDHP